MAPKIEGAESKYSCVHMLAVQGLERLKSTVDDIPHSSLGNLARGPSIPLAMVSLPGKLLEGRGI